MVDGLEVGSSRRARRFRTVSEKRRIAELTLEPGASVALLAGATNHDDTNYGTTTTNRGNVTTKTVNCLSSNCASPTLITSFSYDQTGQVRSMTDPCGNGSCSDMPPGGNHSWSYSYDDEFNTNAYPTKITDPSGNFSQFSYDYNTGQLSSAEDVNFKTTTYTYEPYFGRLAGVKYPDDGGEKTITYNDAVYVPGSSPSVTTRTKLDSNPTKWMTSTAYIDGLGHVVQSVLEDSPSNDLTDMVYDGNGRLYTKTNPHRSNASITDGTTTYFYDALGRPTSQRLPDYAVTGAQLQWCYDGVATDAQTNCHGQLGSAQKVTWVDSADENGNDWQRTSDGLGNLTEVMEPNGSAQGPSLETDYGYDALNDLTSVNQCGAACPSGTAIPRGFSYDSLSRLTASTNPETNAGGVPTSYSYDANGNVYTKTSPAVNASSGTQTLGFCYDPLNRLAYKFYSGSFSCTSPVGFVDSYSYDATAISGKTNVVGRLTDEKAYLGTTLISGRSPFQYDSMGRLMGEEQIPYSPSSGPFLFVYGYDLAGDVTCANNGFAVISATNPTTCANFAGVPQSILVRYAYDGAGNLQAVTIGLQPSMFASTPNLLQANATNPPAYDPWGHLVNGQIGITAGIPAFQVTRSFDNRGRITTETDGSAYSYTVPTGASPGYDGVGNLTNYTDSVMGTWASSYDTLNRLIGSDSTAGPFAQQRGCWTFDVFGNRKLEAYSNQTSTPCAQGANDNLQFTSTAPTSKNQVSGFNYDAAGNVLYDLQNSYRYDLDGKLCAVAYPNGSGGWLYDQYLYDAEGRRVGKVSVSSLSCSAPTSNPISEYLLGLGGEQVTETNGSGAVQHSNVFVAGRLLTTFDFIHGGAHFAFADPLGTKRVQATISNNGTGVAELNCVSLPFGNNLGNTRATDYIPVGSGGTDATEHHFTGKERDTESGNDYFGARYYASSMGRFMSPDWAAKATPVPYAKLDNPQTLNLYAYVDNNPLSRVDPDGHCDAPSGLKPGQVGICVASYIRTTWFKLIGRGDGRDTNGNGGTARIETHLVVDPKTGKVINQGNIVGRSGVLLKDVGPKGTGQSQNTQGTVDAQGNTHFQVSQDAHSFYAADGKFLGSIDNHLNLEVTPDQKVGIDSGSTARDFPSLEVYRYTTDGTTMTTTLVTNRYEAGNGDALKQPETPLPTQAPQ